MVLVVLLTLVGLAFIFLEFFMPGAVLAILGALILVSSVALCFSHLPAIYATLYLFFVLLATLAVCKIALWRIRASGKKGDFYLSDDQEGYMASSFDKEMIGKEGTVATELKPAGNIAIDGVQYSALSESGFISRGSPVEVIGGKGSHLIVRKI
ncbi:MAG: NfeD family protein [Chlamydiota bacterium]